MAVNSQTSRVVLRSAWPVGCSLVALASDQVICRPSTVDRSVRDTSSHHCVGLAGLEVLLQRRDLRDVDHGSEVDAVRVQVQAVVVVDAEVAQRVSGRLAVDEEDARQQQGGHQDGSSRPSWTSSPAASQLGELAAGLERLQRGEVRVEPQRLARAPPAPRRPGRARPGSCRGGRRTWRSASPATPPGRSSSSASASRPFTCSAHAIASATNTLCLRPHSASARRSACMPSPRSAATSAAARSSEAPWTPSAAAARTARSTAARASSLRPVASSSSAYSCDVLRHRRALDEPAVGLASAPGVAPCRRDLGLALSERHVVSSRPRVPGRSDQLASSSRRGRTRARPAGNGRTRPRPGVAAAVSARRIASWRRRRRRGARSGRKRGRTTRCWACRSSIFCTASCEYPVRPSSTRPAASAPVTGG